MEQELAQALQVLVIALIVLLGTSVSVIILARATICAVRIAMRRTRQDTVRPREPSETETSELIMLLRLFPGFIAPMAFVLAIVAVFYYIPVVSNYAFWFL